jgi:hypothetical protein
VPDHEEDDETPMPPWWVFALLLVGYVVLAWLLFSWAGCSSDNPC